MPLKGPDRDEFLQAIYHLNELKTFQKANIHINEGDVAEVNSKKHLPLQVMDVVLGSVCFRLNDKHKERGIDGKRAKRNIVKERLHKHIRKRIWELHPGFNIGVTTPITHSMGHIKTEPQQYAGFIRTGYDAVKEVFPHAIVIVHLDRGHEQSLYDRHLDTLLKYGGKFDMVGMSLYPYWAMDGHPELNADGIITDCISNIRHVSEKYNCDVMIVETGYEVDERHPEKMEEGRRLLARVVREARNETDGHCRGVFYWEPQCLPGGYKLGAFNSKAAPTVIMDGFIE